MEENEHVDDLIKTNPGSVLDKADLKNEVVRCVRTSEAKLGKRKNRTTRFGVRPHAPQFNVGEPGAHDQRLRGKSAPPKNRDQVVANIEHWGEGGRR